MRALVTGGAGFIGSHLVAQLLQEGHHVRVLDNLSNGTTGNLAEVLGEIEFIQGDIADSSICETACTSMEVVFHLGALGSVPRSLADPLSSHKANATGTLNLLQAARTNKVNRFVNSSSSSVYGGGAHNVGIVESSPLMPKSPYAVTKRNTEDYCRVFYECFGIETVSLRYFNVYGPRQKAVGDFVAVIPGFIQALLNDQAPVVHGDGRQTRDFTYVSDIVQAIILASSALGIAGKSFNVAYGQEVSLLEIMEELAIILEKPISLRHVDRRLSDVDHTLADISAARTLLGYAPVVNFRQGLRSTAEYYVKNR
jgi:nucleoside-diphosphate-sugar epimerase